VVHFYKSAHVFHQTAPYLHPFAGLCKVVKSKGGDESILNSKPLFESGLLKRLEIEGDLNLSRSIRKIFQHNTDAPCPHIPESTKTGINGDDFI